MRTETRTRHILSYLWIFATANYLYCDVLTLMDPTFIQAMSKGGIPGIAIDDTFLLFAGAVMEIPIAMILLSRLLPRRANRRTNIVASSAMTFVQVGSFFLGPAPKPHYWLFSAIEIAATLAIATLAWQWKSAESPSSRETTAPAAP